MECVCDTEGRTFSNLKSEPVKTYQIYFNISNRKGKNKPSLIYANNKN